MSATRLCSTRAGINRKSGQGSGFAFSSGTLTPRTPPAHPRRNQNSYQYSRRVFLAMGFVVGLFSHAQAAIILDQSFSSPPNTFSQGIGKGEYGSPMLAQTFQVGVTGVLDSVEVYLCKIFSSATADLQLFIYSTSGGAPSTQVAAAPSLPASSVSTSYSFVSFNLSSASLPVTTGDLLAIVLKAEEPSGTNYGLTGGGGYGPGQKFSNIGGGWSGSSEDLYFRTFVDGVPEPSALVLLGMGAVGLLEFAWRRRKCLT